MEEIRWGIIGCGDVCEVKSGPAFYKCTGSKLVSVKAETPTVLARISSAAMAWRIGPTMRKSWSMILS